MFLESYKTDPYISTKEIKTRPLQRTLQVLEQSHSAGTDIPVVVYGRWYFIMKVNNIHEKNFSVNLIGLEQCTF